MTLTGRTRRAKAQRAKDHIRTAYKVELVGQTWEGFMADYEYMFDVDPTTEQIKARASDFQSIDSYSVTKYETRVRASNTYPVKRVEVKTVTHVRNWSSR